MLRRSSSVLLCWLLIWGLSSVSPAVLRADPSEVAYRVGLRTLGICRPDLDARFDINIWYPSIAAPRKQDFGLWVLEAARNGKPLSGRHPLLLLSHASSGDRFSYHDTAAWLASCGFVVAASTHSHDCLHDMSHRFAWQQLLSRSVELSATIDVLLADKDLGPSIDAERIGMLGFGTGATTGLLLGGALPQCVDWPGWCAQAAPQDEYCNSWGRERISAICHGFPLRHSLADPRIKAIAAVSPGFAMLFGPASFRYFYPPLLLISAEKDRANPPSLHTVPLIRLLGGKARHIVLTDADEGALMATCPPLLQEELPELCHSVGEETRLAIHQRMQSALAHFFLYWLGNDANLPKIPDPPQLDKSEAKQ